MLRRQQIVLVMLRKEGVVVIRRSEGCAAFYILSDYASVSGSWSVTLRSDDSVCIESHSSGSSGRRDGSTNGMLSKSTFNNKVVWLGYLSNETDAERGGPEYSKNMVLVVGGQMMGDGFGRPNIAVVESRFTRSITIDVDGIPRLQLHYRRPWIREFFRSDTWDSSPVDFVDDMIMVIEMYRPSWIVRSKAR